jgi:hypothetical protein
MLSRLLCRQQAAADEPAGPAPCCSQSTIGGNHLATGAFGRMPSGGPAARFTLPHVDGDASPRRDRFKWPLP